MANRFGGYVAPLALAALSASLRYAGSIVPSWLAAVALVFLVNYLAVRGRFVAHSYYATAVSLLLLAHLLLGAAGLAAIYSSLLDLGLLCVVLVALALYWHEADVDGTVARPVVPASILASGIAGVYLGVDHPLRYSLLTILDLLYSSSATGSAESRSAALTKAFLFFLAIYHLPAVEFPWPCFPAFAALHLARNALLFAHALSHLRSRVPELTALDIAVKPVLVAFA